MKLKSLRIWKRWKEQTKKKNPTSYGSTTTSRSSPAQEPPLGNESKSFPKHRKNQKVTASTAAESEGEEEVVSSPTQTLLTMASSLSIVDADQQNRPDGEEEQQPNVSSSLPSFVFPKLLLPLVPEVNPWIWTVINNSLAVSGCALLVDVIFFASVDLINEGPFATAFYLIWEFMTCLFWTLETGLSATYQYTHHTAWPWYTKLELIIALYFTVTTLGMLLQWHVLGHAFGAGEVWEIALDTAFYLYLSLRSCMQSANATETEQDAVMGISPQSQQDYQPMLERDAAHAPSGNQDGAIGAPTGGSLV